MTSHDLSELSVPPSRAVNMPPSPVGGIPGLWTSLDLTDPADKLKLLRAWQGDSFDAERYINKTFQVRDIISAPVESSDKETGEVFQFMRIVLLLTDGTSINFGSKGILNSLQLLCTIYGPPPWTDGLRLTLRQRTTRNGNRTYNLDPGE